MYAVVCGKADMLVLVNHFNCVVGCRAQTVGGIASTLGKTNACCATLGVGSIDSHTFLVAFVGFGQAGPFVLCKGDAVVEEQVVTIAQAPERLLNVVARLSCVACGVLVDPGVRWFCRHPFAVVIRSCCCWWGHQVGKVWQMHYAMWV